MQPESLLGSVDILGPVFTHQLFPLLYQSCSLVTFQSLHTKCHLVHFCVTLGVSKSTACDHLVCTHHNRDCSCSCTSSRLPTLCNNVTRWQFSVPKQYWWSLGSLNVADGSKTWACAESPLWPAQPHNWKVIRTMLLRTAISMVATKHRRHYSFVPNWFCTKDFVLWVSEPWYMLT